jgi:N-acyl-D-amino-acid deacylase
MNSIDIAITGGKVYDGTGAPPQSANIGISGDRIVFPLKDEEVKKAKRIIDAKGLSISPGFINIHGHSEGSMLVDGRTASSLCQGITTEVLGNCSMSMAPLYGECVTEMNKDLEEYGVAVSWEDFDGFFNALLQKGISVNVMSFVGQGTVRGSIMGFDDRKPTPEEMQKMKDAVALMMDQGAWGLSTGLIYSPSSYADTEEIVELAKVAAEKGGIYATHIRGEGDRVIGAIEEAIEIGRRSNAPLEICHLKAAGTKNWGKVPKILEMIREARASGMIIQHDQYPYTISATSLSAILPEWSLVGGIEKAVERFKDPVQRQKILNEMNETYYSNGDNIIVSNVKNEKNTIYEGRIIEEIAREKGMNPFDFVLDLLIEEELAVGAIYMSMCEENVREIMQDPYTAICTDAWARAEDGPLCKGKPHPRTYGSFPRVLGKYARDEKLFSTAEAVRKMTTLPAAMLGLDGRGKITDGFAADLVIFDEETIADMSTIQDPHRYAVGIPYVIINGVIALEKGVISAERPGRVLRSSEEGIKKQESKYARAV